MTQAERRDARVLVADDDPSIRQLVATIIRREGLEADLAIDGEDAIEKLAGHDYSVVLLDLMMPRKDGFDVVAWLKENPPAFKPVILVVTAYADQRFKEVDADVVAGVLRKPFEVADIGSIVRHCVQALEAARDETAKYAVLGADSGHTDGGSHVVH